MNERQTFWADYYGKLADTADHWLDYSNDRVQAQTFGVVFAALGPVTKRRCLDVGCGFGQLASALAAVGAREVVGIDVTEEFIERLREQEPRVRWGVGSLDNAELCARLGRFDVISLVEVLQYMPVRATLERAWSMLEPGGRVVAVVPNRECPIVAKAIARFGGSYVPPSVEELVSIGSSLAGASGFGLQGMFFDQDQTLAPYRVSGWDPRPSFESPPNRLVFAAAKAA